MKDILFLLEPGFKDGDGSPYYCPECMIFEGLLRLYPDLASRIEVRRVAFPRPRRWIVELLGEVHQSCPLLLLDQITKKSHDQIPIKTTRNRHFIDDPDQIGNYLSLVYDIPRPH